MNELTIVECVPSNNLSISRWTRYVSIYDKDRSLSLMVLRCQQGTVTLPHHCWDVPVTNDDCDVSNDTRKRAIDWPLWQASYMALVHWWRSQPVASGARMGPWSSGKQKDVFNSFQMFSMQFQNFKRIRELEDIKKDPKPPQNGISIV